MLSALLYHQQAQHMTKNALHLNNLCNMLEFWPQQHEQLVSLIWLQRTQTERRKTLHRRRKQTSHESDQLPFSRIVRTYLHEEALSGSTVELRGRLLGPSRHHHVPPLLQEGLHHTLPGLARAA